MLAQAATNVAVSPAHLGTAITAGLAAAAPGSLPIEDRTGGGMAITLDKTKVGHNHLIDEDATIAEDWPAETIFRVTNVDTSDHTLTAGGTGTIDGASSVVVVGNGGSVTVEVRSNAGTAPICFAEGDTTQDRTVYGATDFNGLAVSGNLVVQVSRSDAGTPIALADSGKTIATAGACTIPNVPGFQCRLILGGDHDLTHNSLTLDVSGESWGTGDRLYVEVGASNAIEILRVAAASVVTESDFA